MPPVALIQVGDCYFVRDGHHRISVAKALGQKAIDATVEIWQVCGTPSWEGLRQAQDRGQALEHGEPRGVVAGSRPASLLARLFGALPPADGAGASPVCR